MKTTPFSVIIIIAITLTSITETGFAQVSSDKTKKEPFILYFFSGLGSNVGSIQPKVTVKGRRFIYTYEQNSYYPVARNSKVKKISSGLFSQSSIDSIIASVQHLKDSTIFKSNPCLQSGGVHFLTVSDGTDTTKFKLMNTLDSTAIKIIRIINDYLPRNKKLWASETDIKEEEDCWKYLLDTLKKKNKDSLLMKQ